MKKHYAPTGEPKGVCGRSFGVHGGTSNTFDVTCGSCILRNQFQEDHQKAVIAKEAAFMATTPRQFAEPWNDGIIVCRGKVEGGYPCDSTLFRQADRTCYGHYDNFKCSECGHVESRLTETGMSF